MREPSVTLLEDAGLGPEQPGERALAFPCRNAPVDVLLVRAADVPEYVQDGVVDCGVTGADLVRERGADVEELLRLGFGACTLAYVFNKEGALAASATGGLWIGRIISAALGVIDRFLIGPTTGIAARFGDWIPAGDGAIGRFTTTSGRLALAASRAPAVPLVIVLAVVLALVFALVAPGVAR